MGSENSECRCCNQLQKLGGKNQKPAFINKNIYLASGTAVCMLDVI